MSIQEINQSKDSSIQEVERSNKDLLIQEIGHGSNNSSINRSPSMSAALSTCSLSEAEQEEIFSLLNIDAKAAVGSGPTCFQQNMQWKRKKLELFLDSLAGKALSVVSSEWQGHRQNMRSAEETFGEISQVHFLFYKHYVFFYFWGK